ncbi:hypothetical protein BN871_AT_00180 [Paenibacillus sp. P22]|nr:hypothetical protein BN871_AT_00180 [Paenibacillus sp. P22]
MKRSPRYDYVRRPCFDRLSKRSRRKLHKTFRAYEKRVVRLNDEFEPMPRRSSWG